MQKFFPVINESIITRVHTCTIYCTKLMRTFPGLVISSVLVFWCTFLNRMSFIVKRVLVLLFASQWRVYWNVNTFLSVWFCNEVAKPFFSMHRRWNSTSKILISVFLVDCDRLIRTLVFFLVLIIISLIFILYVLILFPPLLILIKRNRLSISASNFVNLGLKELILILNLLFPLLQHHQFFAIFILWFIHWIKLHGGVISIFRLVCYFNLGKTFFMKAIISV